MKKLISTILTVCLIISTFINFTLTVSAASYDPDKAINYAKAHWNEGGGSHQCAEFISKCLTAGGIPMNHVGTGNLSRALLNNGYATKYKITDFSSSRIKFSDYSGKISIGDILGTYCTVCGQYTHVMLVSGSDKNGYVTYYAWNKNKNNATYWVNTYFCNNNSKHTPIETHVLHINSQKTSPVNPPKINITSYPTNIKKGSSYGLRGSVNANGLSTEIRGYILDSKGKTIQSSKVQYTTSSNFDIRYSNVNNQLCFDKLNAGTYTLKITAKNSKGTAKFEKSFTVGGIKPQINLTSYPTNIKKGASYGLRGSVNANGSSTEVRGYILNSNGKTVQSSKVQYTTSSSFDIRYSNVNNQLLFNKLSKGTYTLKITAKNSEGTTTVTKKFTVR